MKKIHEKSPCCQGEVTKFGNRRRQCTVCYKTWRIYKKKRGKKKKRASQIFLLKYLKHEIPSLYAVSRAYQKSEDALNRKLKNSLKIFLARMDWPPLPIDDSLIIIADAMIKIINNETYTFYFILVRKTKEQKAIIVEPFIRKGQEVAIGWYLAFQKLPLATREGVKAIVCDGHIGLLSVAQHYGWIIQRCHFHLLARLDHYQTVGKLSRHGRLGKDIYELARKILTDSNEENIPTYLLELKKLTQNTNSRALKHVISGFIKYYYRYRTYLYYPELHLPRTTNAAESMISEISNLCHRARGFRTPSSLTKWIHAFLKNKQTVTCNGFLTTK